MTTVTIDTPVQQFRIEEDLLGTREVPAEAYYGIHTVRAVENFNISTATISDVPEFVRGMVMTKKPLHLQTKKSAFYQQTSVITSFKLVTLS